MKYIIILFFFFGSSFAFAQIKPDLFPEDILIGDDLKGRCYCSPGVINVTL